PQPGDAILCQRLGRERRERRQDPGDALGHALPRRLRGALRQHAPGRGGDYASAEVYVDKELTVKGGYDATFSSSDPDLHPTAFYGKLTLDHNAAVWGGFRMLGNPINADSWSYMQHRIAAGMLLRNYIEIVVVSGVDPNVLNLYGIVASACPTGVSVLRCNDI